MKTNLSAFTLSFCLIGALTLLLINAGCRSTKTADADGVGQAVQATLPVWPTPSPVVVEVTRVVAVNRQPAPAPIAQAARVSIALPIAMSAPAPSPEPTATPAALTGGDLIDAASPEAALFGLINQQRVAYGLSPLTVAAELNRAARRHSNDMAAYDLTTHTGSDGSTAGQRIQEAGYPALSASEEIFYGSPLPTDALDWWLNDAPHREQLLSPNLTEIGVSYTQLESGRWQHYWTITLGQRAARPGAPQPITPATPAPVVQPVVTDPTPVANGCPTSSTQHYALIPMSGVDRTHPDYAHGDLNLALRGYTASRGATTLVDSNGPTDGDAPRLTTLFGAATGRPFTAAYQVNDWQWRCADPDGCRGEPVQQVEVSLVGIAATPGEAIYAPRRQGEIYSGGYLAAVLYAAATRLTLAYTRDGSVANGYAVHLERICVDPNLLTAYQQANAAGRNQLPALRSSDPVGRAASSALLVAVRDRGSFLDPRSQKDWWR